MFHCRNKLLKPSAEWNIGYNNVLRNMPLHLWFCWEHISTFHFRQLILYFIRISQVGTNSVVQKKYLKNTHSYCYQICTSHVPYKVLNNLLKYLQMQTFIWLVDAFKVCWVVFPGQHHPSLHRRLSSYIK